MKHFAASVMVLLLGVPASAQSSADLLQKGIYAQETAGDIDAALHIFRQVAASPGDKKTAAQAQYQIVLCMLQRGDRSAASRELETLARNFPDQPDLVARARKLLPGGGSMLPAPWGENECSQFNLKRDGAWTGETLYYSVDAVHGGAGYVFAPVVPNQEWLGWELTTKKSTRGISVKTDRTTGQAQEPAKLWSDDYLGDPAVEPLAGPLIDLQGSIFAIRRLPLAVGYKTTLTSLPLALNHATPQEVELAVTGIEPIDVTAGKFKCYKVTLASLGQTFWFGVEGARPLVKFRSGNTEADLMKAWGPDNFPDTELAFFRDAGFKFVFASMRGRAGDMGIQQDPQPGQPALMLAAKLEKVYTPAAEIPQVLRSQLPMKPLEGAACLPETIHTRVIGGQQAVSCITLGAVNTRQYEVWIRSEGASIHLQGSSDNMGIFVWQIDRVLATAKRIP